MTRDQLQQINQWISNEATHNEYCALLDWDQTGKHLPCSCGLAEVCNILDDALAKPEQEPVGCKHNRYSVDVHEQTGTCYDCGAEGRMRFVVDAPAPPTHYDQTALERCEVCGWEKLIPGDCCLNCERGKVEQEPVPAPQREWQGLTKDEINDCAGAEIYSSTWAMAFAIGIEQTLRRKNT